MAAAGRSRRLAACALGVVALLTAGSILAGTPHELPEVALGAPWLVHIERVVAGVLAVSIVVTIAVRISAGQLPLKLGATSIEFESLKDTTARGLDIQDLEIKTLKNRLDDLERNH